MATGSIITTKRVLNFSSELYEVCTKEFLIVCISFNIEIIGCKESLKGLPSLKKRSALRITSEDVAHFGKGLPSQTISNAWFRFLGDI